MRIYFHKDFDGICSAAVFAAYLKAAKPTSPDLEFCAVDYDLKASWPDRALEKPCAIVDFLYHPDAEWWFDHHETTFVRRDWELDYRSDSKHQWRTEYESCPRLILDTMTDPVIREELYHRFSQTLVWCDIIDGAHYTSVREVIEMREPALRINATLSQDTTPGYLTFLVESMQQLSLEQIAALHEVESRYDKARQWQDSAIAHVRTNAVVNKGVAFINATDKPNLFHRYAAYYLWPEVLFQVALYRQGALYKITISMNPWQKSNEPNLGAICEQYGGGGHPDVAGIVLKSKKQALRISEKIGRILRSEAAFHHQLTLSSSASDEDCSSRESGRNDQPRVHFPNQPTGH